MDLEERIIKSIVELYELIKKLEEKLDFWNDHPKLWNDQLALVKSEPFKNTIKRLEEELERLHKRLMKT